MLKHLFLEKKQIYTSSLVRLLWMASKKVSLYGQATIAVYNNYSIVFISYAESSSNIPRMMMS